MRHSWINRVWIFTLICLPSLLASRIPLLAQTSQRFDQEDISVQVEADWAPVKSGGYFPVVMTIQNRGPDASLRIFTAKDPDYPSFANLPIVEKRVSLAQNAKTRITLLIPVVSQSTYCVVRFNKDGRNLDEIAIPVAFSELNFGAQSSLVIDDNPPNLATFESYCAIRDSRGGPGFHSSDPIARRRVAGLPDTWLAYSGFDVVFVNAPAFVSSIDDVPRSELLRWVSTGGSLVLYNVDKLESGLETLEKAIKAANWNSDLSGWKSVSSEILVYEDGAGPQEYSKDVDVRSLMFGKLMAINENPFNWAHIHYPLISLGGRNVNRRSPDETNRYPGWNHVFTTLGSKNSQWSERYSIMPQSSSSDFLNFLNKGIQKLPTWGFVWLISLFAICIGPLNYWWVRKRNQPGLLLVTTPVIALLTSILLIGWSSFANGSANHLRLRSLSMLDQRSQTMVSQTRMAMFSGVTPKDGLRFEPNSMVMPIWQAHDSFQSGSVDWTDAQVMKGSFFQGNSRSQFYVTTPRTERGRINIKAAESDSQLPVSNGLEWSIEYLLVRDQSGKYFFGENLDAGQSITLRAAVNDDFVSIYERIGHQKLVPPVNVMPRQRNNNPYRSRGSWDDAVRAVSMSTNLYEKYFSSFGRNFSIIDGKLNDGTVIQRGIPVSTYVAILKEQPALDIGLEKYEITEQLHVLVGLFE